MSDHLCIADLAKAIHPGKPGHRLMALLKGYFDAAFTDAKRPPGFTAIGGYYGTDETWAVVEREWRDAKLLWGLDEFSIAKIMAGETAVGRTHAEMCVRYFGKIISRSDLVGISAAIRDEDWAATIKNDQQPDRYLTCMHMLFDNLSEDLRLERKGDKVAVVLDTDRQPDDLLLSAFHEWKHRRQELASITMADRRQFEVLECADLCAGTERVSQRNGGWFKQPDKGSLFAFSHAKRHRGSVWSHETVAVVEEAMRKRKEWDDKVNLKKKDPEPS